MAVLQWDKVSEHYYETGVDRGVLYPYTSDKDAAHPYGPGVAWNGLTGVTESPDGAEAEDLYADNIKYLSLLSAETLGLTITAYTYPDEFAVLDGTAELVKGIIIGQQTRKSFGFSYRTKMGNDTEGTDYGYKLHLIYGCIASPSDRDYSTINDSPEAIEFSWEIDTTPVESSKTGANKTASIVIDSTKCDKDLLAKIEAALYGTDESQVDGQTVAATDPWLPMPSDIVAMATSTT